MRILQLNIRNFRGFDEFELKPNGHVVIMGEPGSGKSDIINALVRVLDPYSHRLPTNELDFHRRNTSEPIMVEVTVGDLDASLRQRFLDQLEPWNSASREVTLQSESVEIWDDPSVEPVIRIGYLAEWDEDDDHSQIRRYYPKNSDVENNDLERVVRTKIEQLGFAHSLAGSVNPLSLAPRSPFRRIIDKAEPGDFHESTTEYLKRVTEGASSFGESNQVLHASSQIWEVLATLPNRMMPEDGDPTIVFLPSESSTSALLRSLEPSIDVPNETGFVPRSRLGATVSKSLAVAEVLGCIEMGKGIVAIDDLDDGLDAASTIHLASSAVRRAGQCWITTRSGYVAEGFQPEELVRLSWNSDKRSPPNQGWHHGGKSDRKLEGNWYRVIAPVMSYRAVAVVEGPSDYAALHAYSLRMLRTNTRGAPATNSVSILSAGEQGSGGADQVIDLAQYASRMGMKAIAVLDGDKKGVSYSGRDCVERGISIVQLPVGGAIEKAILDGVDPDIIIRVLTEICEASGLGDKGIMYQDDNGVVVTAMSLMKDHRLHRHVVNMLHNHMNDNMLVRITRAIVDASKSESHQVFSI